ncbi:hypothetical protein DTL21_20235 [Bremerella cremea]|uniref:Uncharacterized protein n=1 Tax=Blastopirellula marina TaxID=124 RepID=A0A2S8FK65_9BACT|nr:MULTISPECIES: hypothetical protein [Pirellulaceae]PQO32541.1 hypothetical protein C5Y83_20215 [Blastopirellula marina]RCS45608.1 hypothetical protein DTL21_20235 [Bremerella cremea]
MSPYTKRILMLIPLALLAVSAGWIVYAKYEEQLVLNRSLKKRIANTQSQIEQVNQDAKHFEDDVIAKMKRNVPVHPVGNSPLNESTLKERGVPILLEQLLDERQAIALYAEHDLFRLNFTQEETTQVVTKLIDKLNDPQHVHHVTNVFWRLKVDPKEVVPKLVAAIDRDTFENLPIMSVRIRMFDPEYNLLPLFIEALKQQDVEGEELIRRGLMSRYFQRHELEKMLKRAIAESSDFQEVAQLQHWVEYVQAGPTQQPSTGPVTSY